MNTSGYQAPKAVQKTQSVQSSQAGSLIKAMELVNKNCPDLNAFFEEFDVYDGRVFEAWEVRDIVQYHAGVTETQILKLCEENQKSEKLMNNYMSYKFLFNLVLTAPDCPHRWKNNTLKPQPYSIYSQKDNLIMGPVQQLICDLLDLPAFAGGRFDDAYDELFGNPIKTR